MRCYTCMFTLHSCNFGCRLSDEIKAMKTNYFLKRIIFLMLASLAMLSCKKNINEHPEEGGKKQTVKFMVTGANNDLGTAGSAVNAPLKDLIKQLTIVVYQSFTGQEYTRVTQLATDPNFGELSLDLPLNTYNFVAIGSRSLFGINQFYQGATNTVILPFNEGNMQYWQPNQSPSEKLYKTDDTFVATIMNTIDANQTINLNMDRIVGKLEVLVEDVANYEVDVNNEATGFLFAAKTSFGSIENDFGYIVNNTKGPISIYILRTGKPLEIEVSGGGKRRSLSVPVYKNKRTVVKGKLLAPIGKVGFSFVINDKWLADTTLVTL